VHLVHNHLRGEGERRKGQHPRRYENREIEKKNALAILEEDGGHLKKDFTLSYVREGGGMVGKWGQVDRYFRFTLELKLSFIYSSNCHSWKGGGKYGKSVTSKQNGSSSGEARKSSTK